MAFHKRRRQPTQNKNEAKARRREEESSRPSLGSVYPYAETLSVRLRFNDARGNFLEEKVRNFAAVDPVDFRVDCPGPCGDGQMDLEGKVRSILQNRETVSESKGKCARELYADSKDTCGYELECHVEVNYRP